MKTLILRILAAFCVSGLLLTAAAQTAPDGMVDDTNAPVMPDQPADAPDAAATPVPGDAVQTPDAAAPAAVDQPAASTSQTPAQDQPASGRSRQRGRRIPAPVASQSAPATESTSADFIPPATSVGTNFNELRLNFRNAPLEMVLNYLSDAAGFIIVLDTPVHGNVSIISSHPVTRNEAVDLLNSVLNKNGYAAIRDGRTLTIVDKNDAKTRDIPVKVSNDPDSIPKNDEIVTQIIPIRFVEARQLVTDLSSFVSAQATVVANEAGNSVVITDTQSNIRHLTQIIRAIDNSAEGETEIRVFHLNHASPTDVANELAQIFPSNNGSGNNQSPIRFGGGGGGGGPGGFFARMMAANGGGGRGGGGGGGGGGNASGNNGPNSRIQKQTQVIAVADPRTSSVVVTASRDLMQEIAGMMTQLDVASDRDQKVFVYHMNNGDPQQALAVLQSMFQNNSTSSRSGSSSSSQSSALMNRETQNATSGNTTPTGTGVSGGNSRGTGGSGNAF